MLIGIFPLMIPELLARLNRMGYGDEIVLADAHFPGETCGKRVLRAAGLKIPNLLDAIPSAFVLDTYVESPLIEMRAAPGDQLDPAGEASCRQAIDEHRPDPPPIRRIASIVMTGRNRLLPLSCSERWLCMAASS